MGPAWCGASRGCFGDVVVVYVPQWPNTCDTYKYMRYLIIHAYTYRYM